MVKKFLFIFVLLIVSSTWLLMQQTIRDTETKDEVLPTITPFPTTSPTITPTLYRIPIPIERARERVTKKPFGIKISPQDSPVQPERFNGYHTGTDFEIFPGEENQAVSVFAICTGQLVVKQRANGYGGVIAQQCVLNNQDVLVVYGHVNLTSVLQEHKQTITAGEKIGVLGQGFSSETDGERKHLHLGIHRGKEIILRGYVGNQAELKNWIDVEPYLS